ncbi:MAG: LysR family transcriptional regulator [Rhodospirillales bacterium 20-64-7]|nr:MAG: LysR family transcriptional regulator [Rhodospirillales bacterium 20-64-7]
MDLIAAFRIFVRVAEAGSFSAVAREMNLSQPAISRQIAALEDHVGERLLQRTTRSLALTDDGRDLLGYAARVLEALDEAETAVGKRRGTVAGLVRLSVPVTFGRLHLAPRLGKLLEAHPGLEIDLLLNDSMPDLVADGIDLAIRPGAIADSSLIVRGIGAVLRYILASRDYLDRYGTPQTPADLARHQCLIFTAAASPREWQFESPSGPVSVTVNGRFRSDSGDVIREGVLSGYGIAALPAWYFNDEIEQGRVRILLPDWQIPPAPVQLIYPSRRNLSPRVRVAMDFLLNEFSDHPVLAKLPKTG